MPTEAKWRLTPRFLRHRALKLGDSCYEIFSRWPLLYLSQLLRLWAVLKELLPASACIAAATNSIANAPAESSSSTFSAPSALLPSGAPPATSASTSGLQPPPDTANEGRLDLTATVLTGHSYRSVRSSAGLLWVVQSSYALDSKSRWKFAAGRVAGFWLFHHADKDHCGNRSHQRERADGLGKPQLPLVFPGLIASVWSKRQNSDCIARLTQPIADAMVLRRCSNSLCVPKPVEGKSSGPTVGTRAAREIVTGLRTLDQSLRLDCVRGKFGQPGKNATLCGTYSA
jgi:hypothetical protein